MEDSYSPTATVGGPTVMIIISVMIMSASYGIPILQHIPTTTEERWA